MVIHTTRFCTMLLLKSCSLCCSLLLNALSSRHLICLWNTSYSTQLSSGFAWFISNTRFCNTFSIDLRKLVKMSHEYRILLFNLILIYEILNLFHTSHPHSILSLSISTNFSLWTRHTRRTRIVY